MASQKPDFEQHLEADLRVLLDPYAAGTIPAWTEPSRARRVMPLVGGAGAALAAKIATGAAIAVLAAGATTGIVVTHSVNPVDWARQVTHPQAQPTQQQPHPARTSPAAAATTSPRAASTPSTPIVSAPALPTVSAPALPSATPLPVPTPSTPAIP
ncbi:MAG TPA: hypothetical protein VFL29_06070 [Candidatus Dormibacteraeota bacterium]|nr:hypothetical protein [Candidatus Dormibacteraeota bacterium]